MGRGGNQGCKVELYGVHNVFGTSSQATRVAGAVANPFSLQAGS